jgi:3-phosphoshikimate 1-carboxyvinyltransferase
VAIGGAEVPPLIDELPLLGIAMAAADGTSEVCDARELRVKESDRIAATVAGLRAIGANVEELPDGWRVSPGMPAEARIATHGDHRIAIAFAVAAAAGVAKAVELDDPECVSVSYPGFWDDLATVTA